MKNKWWVFFQTSDGVIACISREAITAKRIGIISDEDIIKDIGDMQNVLISMGDFSPLPPKDEK